VISAASDGAANVKALVYVAAFAPEVGESIFELSGKFPGSTLASALDRPVDLPGGATTYTSSRTNSRSNSPPMSPWPKPS
jgi:hypothetical protein